MKRTALHGAVLCKTFEIWTKKVWTTPPPPPEFENRNYKTHWIFWKAPQLAQV